MKIILATQNSGKIQEMKDLLGGQFELLNLPEELAGDEIPETGDTFQANALQKARYVFERTGIVSIADDSGLEVDVLDGRPGVYSARYAGSPQNADANMNKLQEELRGKENRIAQFRTVIAVVGENIEKTFEGKVTGRIRLERVGTKGFGYDPLFQPDGYERTFAQMTSAEKELISHRGKAIRSMIAHFT